MLVPTSASVHSTQVFQCPNLDSVSELPGGWQAIVLRMEVRLIDPTRSANCIDKTILASFCGLYRPRLTSLNDWDPRTAHQAIGSLQSPYTDSSSTLTSAALGVLALKSWQIVCTPPVIGFQIHHSAATSLGRAVFVAPFCDSTIFLVVRRSRCLVPQHTGQTSMRWYASSWGFRDT